MKKCPYCLEALSDAAIRCKHCRKVLEKFTISQRKRPLALKVLGTLAYFTSIFAILAVCIIFQRETQVFSKILHCLYWGVMGAIYFGIGYGMFALKNWARKLYIFITLFYIFAAFISIFIVATVVIAYFNMPNLTFLMRHTFTRLMGIIINGGIVYALIHPKIIRYFD